MHRITELPNAPHVAIIGCGAIGGVLAALLAKDRYPISICSTNAEVRRVWATTGPYLAERLVCQPLPSRHIITTPSQSHRPIDIAFVAVPPQQMSEVARSLAGSLHENGRVVCLSNGWCEPKLADILGPKRVFGAVVTWGARMPQPGHYQKTSRGGFILGSLQQTLDQPSVEQLKFLLRRVGPVRTTENLIGARLSKLAINCAISGLGTVGGQQLGKLLNKRAARELGIHLIAEAAQVARADGVKLQNLAGIELEKWRTNDANARKLWLKHAQLILVGFKYRRLRSSILASIERGRSPAIDHINGEIVSIGARLGIPTPYNDAVVKTVWEIARGGLRPGPHALEQVRRMATAVPGSSGSF